MRVLLVQPPQSDPAQPYSSLAVLLGAWRSAGLEVDVADLNLAFFNHLLSPQNLQQALSEIERRLSQTASLEEGEADALKQAAATAGWLETATVRALGVLRDPASFYDPEAYAWAFRTLGRVLSVVSATAYPGRVGLQTFATAYSYLSSEGIQAAAGDPRTNLFLRHIDDVARSSILAARPDVVAVSVTFQTQLIPTWTFAAWIKRWFPEIKVVVGGATITRIKDRLRRAPAMFENIDACVLFEGETAFPALLEQWELGRDGLAAPNVMLPVNGGIATSPVIHVEDLNALPHPDHRGLPLDDYWWPQPALLLNSSRGCYYGRCTFCMISPSTWGPERMGKSYRIRSTEKVIADIAHVHQQTGASAFNLANDILPPRALAEIGEGLAKSGLEVTWDSEIRLERGLTRSVLQRMHEGGCRHLRFGFETASDRVAKLMDKGTDLAITSRILTDCKEIGITVCLLTQVGFPGETVEEAAETLQFLRTHSDRVSFLSLTQFVLETGSGVHQNPNRYGITILPNPEREDLSWMHMFLREDGISVQDSTDLYNEMEAALDREFPDRDLFFKGGLGHAHTTLYTGHYRPERFLELNRTGVRRAAELSPESFLRTARFLSLRQEDQGQSKDWQDWSRFLASSAEVPESLVHIEGGTLMLLLAATGGLPAERLITLTRLLSNQSYDRPAAEDLVRDLLRAGLLLDAVRDGRAAAMQ